MNATTPLNELRADFLRNSTQSMPIAGMLFWIAVGIAALRLAPGTLALVVLCGSGAIFPLGLLIDRLRGRTMRSGTGGNPVMAMFLQSLALVVLLWPLVILAARAAGSADLIVLGGAILMGIIWIPYGWAADDPSGLHHAIGRSVLCYTAYIVAPQHWRPTSIAAAVVLAYLFSFLRMRRPAAATLLLDTKRS